ncbi:MAG: preprotein translocase subunit SecG [candidate division Zixibacteria bacterium]|nr:preprotein translocase subunit SecG [Candidatus Tariuqbacter arcticus]
MFIYSFFIFLHVVICILMVIVILMQASKGKGLAGAFGGGGGMAASMLGARGTATFLSKATTYLATAFIVNCIILTLLSRTVSTPRSAVQDAMQSPAQALPLVPGTMERGIENMSLPSEVETTLPPSGGD